MQLTTNYKLRKPDGTDNVDINDFNYNADTLDNVIKTHNHDIITGGNANRFDLTAPNDCCGLSKQNNVDIKSWYGVSISNACGNAGVQGRPTVSFDARTGNAWFEGDIFVKGQSKGLFQSVSDGKSAIANAITDKGVSASSSDSFDTLASKIKQITTGVNTSDATATASQILSGQTAYVNGSKITGSMANQGAKTASLNCGGSYTIPAGYHNGSGKVTANSLASQTSANATASDIISGKTAWVNGNKITGTATMQSLGGLQVKTGSENYVIPAKKSTFLFSKSGLGFTPKVIIIYWTSDQNNSSSSRQGTAVYAAGYKDALGANIVNDTYKYFDQGTVTTEYARGTTSYNHTNTYGNADIKNGSFKVGCTTSYAKNFDETVILNWVAIG